MFSICRLILIATVALFGLCCYILALKFGNVFLFFVVLGGVAWAVRRRRGKFTAYGTARWAGQEDVRRAGMGNGHGLIVGTLYDRKRPSRIGARSDSSIPSCRQCGRRANSSIASYQG